MEFELNDEQRMIRDLCRDFAQHEIAPHAEQWYDAGEFPTAVFRKLAELQLMGLLIPEEYGGSNTGTVAFVAAMEELARVDQSIAATWNAHLTIGSLPYLHFGTEEQKQRYLVPLARGEILGAFGLTEPEAGSDAANISTAAILDGDSWVINGTKCFITNAGTPLSYGLVVLAVTGRDAAGKKRYSTLIVPRDTPGYTVGRRYHKVGWHTVDTREQVFEDCRVARENLLGPEGAGLRQFMQTLDVGRISIAALSVGLARAALELALAHAQQRVTFGKRLSQHQAIQFKLADIATAVEAARLLAYRAAWLRDSGRPYAQEAAMAKLFASEAAVRAAEEAVQIHGGYGYTREHAVSRFYLDSKILTIGEGTSEVQRMVIARHLGC
ncbi:MAG: acyl-CoA dehydrogenase family protein [Deltaproteobacteria bacterium]|nr:acyl-CoA dehydrogenase family protein [Deltaproteobacteria bacterium]